MLLDGRVRRVSEIAGPAPSTMCDPRGPLSVFLLIGLVAIRDVRAQEIPPAYVAEKQIKGTIHVWGSPQMSGLLHQYEVGFVKVQPAVKFEEELKSTITAVAGVYTGRAQIGLLGREIWPTEEEAFKTVAGHAPLVVDVATGSYDVPKATFALMVFVPAANPITNISLAQLEQAFGEGDAAGTKRIRTWGELGLTGDWTHRPVNLYGFAIENDKSKIFAKIAFGKGERWSAGLHESSDEGAASAGELVMRAVQQDPNAIGISNVHYATAGVRALALSSDGQPPVAPTKASVAMRQYALTRAVYMIVDADQLDVATREFLRFVLSSEGAEAVVREGNYLPLKAAVALRELRKIATGK